MMRNSGTPKDGATPRSTATAWMSLKDASELTGTSRAELRSRIAAGELTSRTIKRGDKVEHRLTRASLAEAGLIGVAPVAGAAGESPAQSPLADEKTTAPESEPDTMAQLIGLIREQNQRIANLEDQRAQLAARLGATVEAMHQLEDRLEAILDERLTPLPAAPTVGGQPITTDDGLVVTSTTGSPTMAGGTPTPSRETQLHGVRRSLSRLVREVAQPRLRELTGGPRREPSPGD